VKRLLIAAAAVGALAFVATFWWLDSSSNSPMTPAIAGEQLPRYPTDCTGVFRASGASYQMPNYLDGCYEGDSIVKDTGINCVDRRILVTHEAPPAWAFVDSVVHLTDGPPRDDAGYKNALELCSG